MFSIQATWDDSVAFIKREQALLVPLALGTIGLGNILVELAQDASKSGKAGPADMALSVLLLPAILWLLIGQLAIVTLALRKGCSVGEALRHGAARMGILLLISVMLGVVLTLMLLPPLIAIAPYAAQLAAKDYAHLHLPLWASLWCLGLFALLFYFSTRLFVLVAVILERRDNPFALLQQSFALTRGVFWKLFAFTIGVALFTLILQGAVAASFGLITALLGKLIGSPFTGKILESLAQSVLVAGLGGVQAVFVAKAYQRLAGGAQRTPNPFG